jgi:hypothetical protein
MKKLVLCLILIFSYFQISAQCNNLTDGGTITSDEYACSAFDPDVIVSAVPPSGGSGVIEYMWIKTYDPNNYGAADAIPGAHDSFYDPPMINQTTWFVRCARRVGCSDWVGESIVKKEIYEFHVQLEIDPISCSENSLGGITINPLNGQAPYTFYWNGIEGPITSSSLPPTSYVIEVYDGNGCYFVDSVELISSDLSVSLDVFDEDCSTENDYVNVEIQDGHWPYDINWSNGSSSYYLSGQNEILSGLYTVEVTDASGCTITDSVNFDSGVAPKATIDCCLDTVICEGGTSTIPINFVGDGPWVLTWEEGNEVKTDTFYNSTGNITVQPSETIIINLISVVGQCGQGQVCGKVTIAVNDCDPNACNNGCFYASIYDIVQNQDCYEYEMYINSNGCQHDLSNMLISIPCGTISNMYNSYGYQMEITSNPDPNTGLVGIKIETPNGIDEFNPMQVKFDICQSNCGLSPCEPILSFKAANCVQYEQAETYQTMYQWNNAYDIELKAFPNPFNNKTNIHITTNQISTVNADAEIQIVDINGVLIKSWELDAVSYYQDVIEWDGTNQNGKIVDRGMYIIHYRLSKHRKASERIYKY